MDREVTVLGGHRDTDAKRKALPDGRPGIRSDARGTRGCSLGVDLGGTKVSAVVLGDDGMVTHSSYRPHDGTAHGAESALIEVIARSLCDGSRVGTVGVAAAGLVDRDRGVLVESALLHITDFPLTQTVSAALGIDVLLENDANATLAGIQSSASGGVEVLLALGTGVGGAVSVNGSLVDGSFGFAAELGHIPIESPGRNPCPCGSSGCLELFASGTAIARAAAAASISGVGELPPRAEDVVAAARANDATALQILASAGTAIGTALCTLIPVLDPAVIYISGGFGHAAADLLIPAAERRLGEQLPFAGVRPGPRILADPVGPLAAAIGAARLARRHAADTT
jgi:glucokinase